jgi:hypothetical protein
VWTGSSRTGARHQLAAAGTAVAIDHDRVAWATATDCDRTTIVSGNRRSKGFKVPCGVDATASSLSVGNRPPSW